MRKLVSWFLALNPLLLYRWHTTATLTLMANSNLTNLAYPQLKVYCVLDEQTLECVEAFVMKVGEKGCVDFTWQEDRFPGETPHALMVRALKNASQTYHKIHTKYVESFGVPPA